jgi:hypothetical protein
MSSSESELEDHLPGYEDSSTDDNVDSDIGDNEYKNIIDDLGSNTVDDAHNKMSNGVDDDGGDYNIEDTNQFLGLYDSFQEPATSDLSQSHPVDDALINRFRSAMDPFSHSSSGSNLLLKNFGDFLDSYLFAPPLIQRITPSTSYYFAYDLTTDTSGSKLFVENVPRDTTWQQLKDFFVNQGYDVKHVNLQYKPAAVYKYFCLKLLILNIARFFRMFLVMHSYDLALPKLLHWHYMIM